MRNQWFRGDEVIEDLAERSGTAEGTAAPASVQPSELVGVKREGGGLVGRRLRH
ncbi:MAG: hypothetical protein VKK63_11345 [Synechococcus sp.]|nr:hypothetical protein [Synechococcus sp.]